MKYKHLTTDSRCQIYALKSTGHRQKAIAKHLGVAASTISRELKRNIGKHCYRYKQADRKSIDRRRTASSRPKKLIPEVIKLVELKLLQKWSPEQIAGRLRHSKIFISHASIYRHIWADKTDGGTLYIHLRRRGKKYNHRGAATAGRGCIPDRVDISERPKIVDKKTRLGDWEGDTIIGAKHKGVILTMVDRKSKFTLLSKMNGKFAAQVPGIIKRLLNSLPCNTTDGSITFDNGKEFSHHKEITKQTNLKCYFATPYRSWERGLNEHTNGLVRQYCPKGTDLTTYCDEEIKYVENQLNNRPRKVLCYRTPREVFMGVKRSQKIALHC